MTGSEVEAWAESREYQIPLDSRGMIVDFLDPTKKRPNTPEERVRQRMTQVLHFEYGYPKNCLALERSINIGVEKKRADIVVYLNSSAQAENDQGSIYLIGETKNNIIKESDGQCISYISATSAQGGFWTNGNKIEFYRKNVNTGKIDEWLGIPKYNDAWDSIGRYSKSDLINPIDLTTTFRRCHNALYRSGIDSEDIALDMVRVILAKVEDESSSKEECDFYITPEEYSSKTKLKVACQRVRALFNLVRDRYTDVFESHERITSSDKQLAIVISHLQQYSFLDASHDVLGMAYEVYVASHLKGERGQFFTNRLVVQMMIEILEPNDKDIILDPACGSGGFLLFSMNYIFSKIDESKRPEAAKEMIKRNVVHQLFGVDISPKLVKIAKANMLLGKDGHGGIEKGNSLASVDDLSEKFRERAGMGLPSIILTNPPFGAGHDLRVKEPNILKHYASGMTWSFDDDGDFVASDKINQRMGVAPEILFLERCIEWVKDDGYIGIVMAKGQLDNREAYPIRRLIFEKCRVVAVVNLHEDTFEPFCGSKASVIFLQKKKVDDDYRIYMAISNKVGQTSRGEPIFKRDSEGTPVVRDNFFVLDEDLSDIAQSYKLFSRGELSESDYRFSISVGDINKETLSLNPVQYLPQHNASVQHVLKKAESDDYEVHRLGDIAMVFNGPRFKRPYADLGVTEGSTIRKYFTGTALTQLNSDNVKYLDSSKGNTQTAKHLEKLTIYKGYILVSDSGTLGRVTYALNQHDGHVATNNLIRIVIEDEALRGYVYQYLKSELGQSLMLKNAYGTNQEHLEPDVISEVPILLPSDRKVIESIGGKVIASIERLEESIALSTGSMADLYKSIIQ